MAHLNYFTCTLGQAVTDNERNPHAYETIIDFLEHQAQAVPDDLAVGFPIPGSYGSEEAWDHRTLSMCYSAPLLDTLC